MMGTKIAICEAPRILSALRSLPGMRRGLITQGHMSHSFYCLVDFLTATVCCSNDVHLSIYILSSALYGCNFHRDGSGLCFGWWEMGDRVL